MMAHAWHRPIGATLLWAVLGTATATPSDFPPPGEYRIDTETTRRLRTPGGEVVTIERIDGATGEATLTQQAPGMSQPVVTRVPGSGPVRHCQGVAGPPPAGTPCQARSRRTDGQTVIDTQCAGQSMQASLRALGNGVWEQRHRVPAGSMNGMEVDSVQRWTLLSSHCSGGR